MKVNSAAMRHHVVIQKAVIDRNLDGSERKSWVDDIDMSVEFVAEGGREMFHARTVTPELTHLLKGRWRVEVSPDRRVRYPDPKIEADRFFDIRAAENPDQTRTMLLIHCKELIGREIQS